MLTLFRNDGTVIPGRERGPRGYFKNLNGQVESNCLYGFCDASKRAYVAVIYLVTRMSTDTYVQLVVSKTRVAPIRSQSIPRLELLSALLWARLMSTTTTALSSQLKLESQKFYSDSQVAFYWICGQGKQWKPFVQNRVNEITKLTKKDSGDTVQRKKTQQISLPED